MATEVDWESLGGSRDENKKSAFIKFEAGKQKVFRPIGKPVTFYKFFIASKSGNKSLVVDPEYKDKAAAMLSAHAGQEFSPNRRFAIHVIDREDGEIKILEQGTMIFNAFADWSQASGGTAPGHGQAGFDWAVTATGDGKARRYRTVPVKQTPLTKEEIEAINARKKDGKFSLSEVFVGCSLEDLIEKAFGVDSAPAAESSSENISSNTSSDTDDPIDW